MVTYQPFNIKRVVRQDCPFSYSYYVLCIELLFTHIETNENIKGI